MRKLQPALAASLGVLVGLAAVMSSAEARGGGGGGHGGFGGGFAAPRGYGGEGGYSGYGGRGGFADGYGYNGGRNNFGPGGNGYGPYPGRPNPWANAWGGVFIDPGSIPYSVPATNTNVPTPPPNDCNYLFQKAIDSNSPYMWTLFNACSHGR